MCLLCCKFGISLSRIFFAGKVWCSGDICLNEHLFKVGWCLYAHGVVEQVFGGRNVAVASSFLHKFC